MRLVLTSDFHGFLPDKVPECDLLLIAGDVCPVWNHDRRVQALWLKSDFADWLREQPATDIVGISGNHDFVLEVSHIGEDLPWIYLEDTNVEIQGLKIHGSPYSNKFGHWAFMRSDENLDKITWPKIPKDVDVLLIHGPAYGCGDLTIDNEHVGSMSLEKRLRTPIIFPKLKLYVFGHIHEAYGQWKIGGVPAFNASHVDIDYKPVNPVWEFEL